MKTSDYWYELPENLIAHRPLEQRDQSRLLHIHRKDGLLHHCQFSDLLSLLHAGDRLVFNNTKVIPGRLFATKGTGVRMELLFTRELSSCRWEVIAKPSRRLKPGVEIALEKDPSISFNVEGSTPTGGRILTCATPILPILEKYGEMPIPPYMERRADEVDRLTYQTVYADSSKPGAVAAPTAGLHFTDELLEALRNKGVDISFITLHVGIGTFRPIKVENPVDHVMHSERYEVSASVAHEINATKENGGRIIAVGTTVVRTLESVAHGGVVRPQSGETSIFIWPGFHFQVVDCLITNFHLPESTLIMLVSALYNREKILEAYKVAVENNYRFFSYGDSMFIE